MATVGRAMSPPEKCRIIEYNTKSEVASKILKFKQEAEERDAKVVFELQSVIAVQLE